MLHDPFPSLAAVVSLGLALVVCPADAQVRDTRDQSPGGIYLPLQSGTSLMSANVSAQAEYITSMGDYVESALTARDENAPVGEHEVRDTLEWVSTYFQRRDLNRAFYLKANPNYLGNEQHRQELLKRRITQLFEKTLRGDQTAELNWLLHQLAGMTLPYQYLTGDKDKTLSDAGLDRQLSPEAIHQIVLTDGGYRDGRLLTFRADTAEVLETPWPRALRDDRFDQVRADFENARDQVLARRAQGKRDWETEKRLMTACDALCDKFNEIYPREVRVRSTDVYMTYAAGKRFLQALAAGVLRAITTEDQWVFDGRYRFDGHTLMELVQHMCQHGLEFAPCYPGGEGVYRVMFDDLRRIYLRLAADDPYRNLEQRD